MYMLNANFVACRFLKSDLYKDSLLADMGGTPLPFNGLDLEPLLSLDTTQVCSQLCTSSVRPSVVPL